ncbi:MAG: hypothetical protein ACRC37_05640, partial [Lentisphaeria bacterium]
MKTKTTIILFIVSIILLAIVANFKPSHNILSHGEGSKFLPDLPVDSINKIRLKEGDKEVTIIKNNDLWQVVERDNYPANINLVRDFFFSVTQSKIMRELNLQKLEH